MGKERKGSLPRHAVYLDTEAYEGDSESGKWPLSFTWRLGCAVYCRYEGGRETSRTYRDFGRAPDLWEWVGSLVRRKEPLWVFAHNLGFDSVVSGFWQAVQQGWGELKHVTFADPPTLFTVATPRGLVKLADSLNYLLCSVSKMADWLGVKRPPLPSCRETCGDWWHRCRADVTILADAMGRVLAHVGKYGGQCWASSVAGVGWRIWRRHYQEHRTDRHADPKFRKVEREGYYVGECAAYRVGRWDGPWVHADVNGLYPWVMKHALFPACVQGSGWTGQVAELAKRCGDGPAVARVFVADEETPRPRKEEGRTYRTVGTYWTTLAGAELSAALGAGAVRAVRDWVHYTPAPLFTHFVYDLYGDRLRARDRGDEVTAAWSKAVMTSLSGKFAQRSADWIDRPDLNPLVPYGVWPVRVLGQKVPLYRRAVAGLVQEQRERVDWEHARPAVAACITAAGRERMRQLRELAGPETVVYQDTDGLILQAHGWERLVRAGEASQTRLGALKVKWEGSPVQVWGVKRYATGGVLTASGIDRGQAVCPEGAYTRLQWQSLQSQLTQGPTGAVGFRRQLVTLYDSLEGGFVATDGRVLPLTVTEVL